MSRINPNTPWRDCGIHIYSPARLIEMAHWGKQSKSPIVQEAGDSLMSFAVFSLSETTVFVPKELEPALLLLISAMPD